MNPTAWEEMMAFIHPILNADTFAFDKDDHVDDGVPVTASEWDLI